jgi:cell wall-associated NlpC family hydrolase
VATTAVTGAMIAAAGRKYAGAGYTYGGPGWPPGNWDCSSFVSAVLGHDLGMGLPGGRWGGPGMPPAVHGPVVMSYVTWSGADPVPAGRQSPGDLACFAGLGTGGHIGIVLGPDEMVSALDTAQGTLVSPIQGYGPPGAPLVYRRVHGTGTTPAPGPGGATGWGGLVAPLLLGALAGAGMVAVVVGGAAAMAAAGLWMLSRVARSGAM